MNSDTIGHLGKELIYMTVLSGRDQFKEERTGSVCKGPGAEACLECSQSSIENMHGQGAVSKGKNDMGELREGNWEL